MEQLQLGKIFGSFEAGRIGRCAESIKKKIRGMTIEYYNAKLPISRTFGKPKYPKKCAPAKANCIVLKRKGKTVIEFYGTGARASGKLDDKKFTKLEYKLLLGIMGKYEVYTFESLKALNPDIKYAMLALSFFMLWLAADIFLFVQDVPGKMAGLLTALFASMLMMLYMR
ncbi:MAG: hypothetical protein V1911_04285 [Candidatus Micrarchaeota archaeon]